MMIRRPGSTKTCRLSNADTCLTWRSAPWAVLDNPGQRLRNRRVRPIRLRRTEVSSPDNPRVRIVVAPNASATVALAEPEDARASPRAMRQDRKRIKELERDLLRKDRALAETTALLVLSKKSRGNLQQR